ETQADQLRVQLDVAGHSQVTSIHFAQTFVIRWMRGDLTGALAVVEAGTQASPRSLTWWALRGWIAAGSADEAGARAVLAERSVDELAATDPGYLWLFAVLGAAVTATAVADEAW